MKKIKWYQSEYFNLLPTMRSEKATETSCGHFHFSWLCFNVWSLLSVQFEVSIFAFGHFGFGFSVQLPYLAIVVSIPMSDRVKAFWWDITDRKPCK